MWRYLLLAALVACGGCVKDASAYGHGYLNFDRGGGDNWTPLSLDAKLFAWWDGTDRASMSVDKGGAGSAPAVDGGFRSWTDKSANAWRLEVLDDVVSPMISRADGVQYPTGAFVVRGSYGNMATTDWLEPISATPTGGLWAAFYAETGADLSPLFTNRSSPSFAGVEILYDESLDRIETMISSAGPFKSLNWPSVGNGNFSAGIQHTGTATGESYLQVGAAARQSNPATLTSGPWSGSANHRDAFFVDEDGTTGRVHHIVLTTDQLTDTEIDQLFAFFQANRSAP